MVLTTLSLFLLAADINIKKKYCKNRNFIPNEKIYPHLHCDKKFLTLSLGGGKHINFKQRRGLCRKIFDLFDVNKDKLDLHLPIKDITDVLEDYFDDNCLNEDLELPNRRKLPVNEELPERRVART